MGVSTSAIKYYMYTQTMLVSIQNVLDTCDNRYLYNYEFTPLKI